MVTSLSTKSKRFCLYNITLDLQGEIAEKLARDFDFFTGRPGEQGKFSVQLVSENSDPKQESIPATKASRIFPECAVFTEGGQEFFEYEDALLIVKKGATTSSARIISQNSALAEELGFLYLQSEIGRFLEAQHLHRVHALGLGTKKGRGVLVLLPSGGGKSTLALELLQQGGCVLLSDDSPLITRSGQLLPYPLRLSFREGTKLPEEWATQKFERRKYGSKILVPTSSLGSHLLPRPQDRFKPGYLFVGQRFGAKKSAQILPMSKRLAVFPLFRDLVVGLGVPQVAELVLTKGMKSLPGLAPVAASRLMGATAFLSRAKTFSLELSRDSEENARCILDFLRNEEGA